MTWTFKLYESPSQTTHTPVIVEQSGLSHQQWRAVGAGNSGTQPLSFALTPEGHWQATHHFASTPPEPSPPRKTFWQRFCCCAKQSD